jgi:hypothetical protein
MVRPAYACASPLRRKRAHDGVDDLVRVFVVEGSAAEEEPVEQRPDQQLVSQPDIGIGTQVARGLTPISNVVRIPFRIGA